MIYMFCVFFQSSNSVIYQIQELRQLQPLRSNFRALGCRQHRCVKAQRREFRQRCGLGMNYQNLQTCGGKFRKWKAVRRDIGKGRTSHLCMYMYTYNVMCMT